MVQPSLLVEFELMEFELKDHVPAVWLKAEDIGFDEAR